MRLLNAQTRKLETFVDEDIASHPYAILSHTWGNEEVTFDDIDKEHAPDMLGYRKIDFTCKQALQDGFTHVWVDTCCIDKRSSAELSESINSMYHWYYHARICYVYLSDVTWSPARKYVMDEQWLLKSNISTSRWFSRGWTLQELIAPKTVQFFNYHWTDLGFKSSIVQVLSDITKISTDVLHDRDHLIRTSIAQRMSWSACRNTSRLEDQAYALLGIFNVNMPLLYGEGTKAFTRLQEEIIRSRSWDDRDHSLLLWSGPSIGVPASGSLLASSPAAFKHAHHILHWALSPDDTFEITNKGLRMSVYAKSSNVTASATDDVSQSSHCPEDRRGQDSGDLLVALNCRNANFGYSPYALRLRRRPRVFAIGHHHKLDDTRGDHIYDRLPENEMIEASDLCEYTLMDITIAHKPLAWPRISSRVSISDYTTASITGYYPGALVWSSYQHAVLDLADAENYIAHGNLLVTCNKSGDVHWPDLVLAIGLQDRGSPPRIFLQGYENGRELSDITVSSKLHNAMREGVEETIGINHSYVLRVKARYALDQGELLWNLEISGPFAVVKARYSSSMDIAPRGHYYEPGLCTVADDTRMTSTTGEMAVEKLDCQVETCSMQELLIWPQVLSILWFTLWPHRIRGSSLSIPDDLRARIVALIRSIARTIKVEQLRISCWAYDGAGDEPALPEADVNCNLIPQADNNVHFRSELPDTNGVHELDWLSTQVWRELPAEREPAELVGHPATELPAYGRTNRLMIDTSSVNGARTKMAPAGDELEIAERTELPQHAAGLRLGTNNVALSSDESYSLKMMDRRANLAVYHGVLDLVTDAPWLAIAAGNDADLDGHDGNHEMNVCPTLPSGSTTSTTPGSTILEAWPFPGNLNYLKPTDVVEGCGSLVTSGLDGCKASDVETRQSIASKSAEATEQPQHDRKSIGKSNLQRFNFGEYYKNYVHYRKTLLDLERRIQIEPQDEAKMLFPRPSLMSSRSVSSISTEDVSVDHSGDANAAPSHKYTPSIFTTASRNSGLSESRSTAIELGIISGLQSRRASACSTPFEESEAVATSTASETPSTIIVAGSAPVINQAAKNNASMGTEDFLLANQGIEIKQGSREMSSDGISILHPNPFDTMTGHADAVTPDSGYASGVDLELYRRASWSKTPPPYYGAKSSRSTAEDITSPIPLRRKAAGRRKRRESPFATKGIDLQELLEMADAIFAGA